MNLEDLIAGEERTHPNHGEQDGHGTKDGFRWGNARNLLRDIETIDCHVQCRENPILVPLLLGFVGHGRNAKRSRRGVRR